jgi:hypothetical protein
LHHVDNIGYLCYEKFASPIFLKFRLSQSPHRSFAKEIMALAHWCAPHPMRTTTRASSSRFRLHFSEVAISLHGVPQGLPTRGWTGEELHLAVTIIVEPFDVPLARDHDVLENAGGFGHYNLPVGRSALRSYLN